jgi:hypothetical protein
MVYLKVNSWLTILFCLNGFFFVFFDGLRLFVMISQQLVPVLRIRIWLWIWTQIVYFCYKFDIAPSGNRARDLSLGDYELRAIPLYQAGAHINGLNNTIVNREGNKIILNAVDANFTLTENSFEEFNKLQILNLALWYSKM